MVLAQLSWPEIRTAKSRICLVPLGSLEQHGPHLPLWTDTAIISAIASRVEQRMPEAVLLAPAQPIGYSPHHAHFGCLSLDLASYMALIRSVCRSFAAMGFDRILLLNGHGGNDVPCRAALCEMKEEHPALHILLTSYWTLAAEAFRAIRSSPIGGMGHACEMETSVMLTLHPEQVDMAKAKDDGPFVRRERENSEQPAKSSMLRVADMLRPPPYFMVRNFDEISENGTVGAPSFASAEKGDRFLEAAVDAVCELVAAYAAGELEFPSPKV
jgi:creatinine amidohydrolase